MRNNAGDQTLDPHICHYERLNVFECTHMCMTCVCLCISEADLMKRGSNIHTQTKCSNTFSGIDSYECVYVYLFSALAYVWLCFCAMKKP